MHDLERYGLTPQDLPTWLRPRQYRFDYALLSVILLSLVVAWPWLQSDGLPNTIGAWESIFRIAEVADSLQSGDIYPRWASRYHFSYGSPLFNYLAPTPHYVGGLHFLMTQASPRLSLQFMMTASIVMAGTGMFLITRRRWGTLAGFCAALVYLLAPPLLLTLPYISVDLPLLLAAGVFPCLLWSLDRVLAYGDGRDIGILVILTALQITSHTVMGLIFFGMMVGWLLWLMLIEREKFYSWAFISVFWGICLSAVYWLPAFAERNEVYWRSFTQINRPLRLTEALGLLPPQDFAVFNPDFSASLGLAAWGLFILGSLVCLKELTNRHSRKSAAPLLPFILIAPILLWIATQYESRWLDSIAKFPSLTRPDLLVPIAACCALVAGQCAKAIDQYLRTPILKVPASLILMGSILGASLPTIQPPPFVPYRFDDALKAHLEAELRGTISGSFQEGQLLPKTVETLPAPSFYLLDSYERGQVEKINRSSQIGLARSDLAIFSHSPTHDQVRINIFEPNTQLEFLTLNFKGWEAEFRNSPVPVTSAPVSGLIQVTLPEGSGILNVSLNSTPVRTAGTLISLAILLILPIAALLLRKPMLTGVLEGRFEMFLTFSLGVTVIAGIFIARDTVPTQSKLETMTSLPIVFEGGVDLLGYSSETSLLKPGQVTPITLFWQAGRPNLPDYQFRVQLEDSDTVIWSETHRAPGGWPTSYWLVNRYVQDTYWIQVPENVPVGDYQLTIQVINCETISLYICDTSLPRQAFEARGKPLGDRAALPITLAVR